MQSDAITPLQPVPQSIAAFLGECRERSKLSLGKFTAEAAEQAALHRDNLLIASKVKDVASVHSTLCPEKERSELIEGSILIGMENVWDLETGIVATGPDAGKRVDPETGEIVSGGKRKELPDTEKASN